MPLRRSVACVDGVASLDTEGEREAGASSLLLVKLLVVVSVRILRW